MKKQASTTAFDIVKTIGLALPEVENMTNWAGTAACSRQRPVRT
jgi:hypothetical protein